METPTYSYMYVHQYSGTLLNTHRGINTHLDHGCERLRQGMASAVSCYHQSPDDRWRCQSLVGRYPHHLYPPGSRGAQRVTCQFRYLIVISRCRLIVFTYKLLSKISSAHFYPVLSRMAQNQHKYFYEQVNSQNLSFIDCQLTLPASPRKNLTAKLKFGIIC